MKCVKWGRVWRLGEWEEWDESANHISGNHGSPNTSIGERQCRVREAAQVVSVSFLAASEACSGGCGLSC